MDERTHEVWMKALSVLLWSFFWFCLLLGGPIVSCIRG